MKCDTTYSVVLKSLRSPAVTMETATLPSSSASSASYASHASSPSPFSSSSFSTASTCLGYPTKLVIAKMLFFCTSMSGVGWNRFQSIYFLQRGLNPGEIGLLKSLGLVLKVAGEPFWCIIADMTDEKTMFVATIVMNVVTMEILRMWQPLTFNVIFAVKVLRTVTAPGGTLTTTASFKLTEGSKEGYGQQRMFGSLAWGFGALAVGFLIGMCTIAALKNIISYHITSYHIISLDLAFRRFIVHVCIFVYFHLYRHCWN